MCYTDRVHLLPKGLPARGLVLWTGCPNCRTLVTKIGQPLYTKLDRRGLIYYTEGPPAAQRGFPAYVSVRPGQRLELDGGIKVPVLLNGKTRPVYGPSVAQVRGLLVG